jgi:putative ATPase
MKALPYNFDLYFQAHDEPEAYAAGESYLPEGLSDLGWYQPTPRGLEGKIAEKLAYLRQLDAEARRKAGK